MRGKLWIGVVVLVVAGLGGLVWNQRQWLEGWWLTRGLAGADEIGRQVWIERLTAMGEPAVEPLLGLLGHERPQAQENALAALDHLARLWGSRADSTAALSQQLAQTYPRLTTTLQPRVLRTVAEWCAAGQPGQGLQQGAIHLLQQSAASTEEDTLVAALNLARVLCQQGQRDQVFTPVRQMVRSGLRSALTAVRLRAVQLSLLPDLDLLEEVAGLLRDSNVEIRRAAVVAVGPAEHIVREDLLLVGLHDPDAEVRRLTEAALRSRGLRPEQLELGRLVSHPESQTRLRVLQYIRDVLDAHDSASETDIDPGVWLRRLSHDASPAVRAATLRLMSQQSLIDLTDRIDQMAHADPSPTVSQLAQFYLRSRKNGESHSRSDH